jgi:hydrogenase maturation protein HypF
MTSAEARHDARSDASSTLAVEIRVRGRVQGVGFRPMVCRLARALDLKGTVATDAQGVLVCAMGDRQDLDDLKHRLRSEAPPLAAIESIEVTPWENASAHTFEIVESVSGNANAEVAPDAALCPDCAAEIFDPFSRRYRYPFTTCTSCGPRLSVLAHMPYDRASTSMAPFDLCPQCAAEYTSPGDRRFHAETIACHVCGPRAKLARFDGRAFSFDQVSMLDDVDAALGLIQKGEIVAIKGLGGYHLAGDATRADVVARLRLLKHCERKPFALMARDLDIIRRYASVSPEEEAALTGPAGPIVLLRAEGSERLPDAVAPGLTTLGFMLPTTPLHALLLRRMSRPVVMTSGNIANAPQVISDADAAAKLAPIAPFALLYDRDILNRVDDSVVGYAAGDVRVLRRARGYAPAPVPLPSGFERAPEILAFGGDLKSAFALVRSGQAVLSQHVGDLDDADTLADFSHALALYREMFAAKPAVLAADLHPGYRSANLARRMAQRDGLPLIEVQHHHAHVASCLAENGWPLDGGEVLGIALDGLGYGADGEIWGGEFLLADYARFERLGTFKPVAMLGGDQASREPWRNLYAHLMAQMGWPNFTINFSDLELHRTLAAKPRASLDAMLRDGLNVPRASSCGRLFDAAAAAVGLCFERQDYEGEAAAQLECAVDRDALAREDKALDYPFTIPRLDGNGLPYIEPLAVWNAILGDLILNTPVGTIAARFHRGLARTLAAMAVKLARQDGEERRRFDTVALSGGCFHNRILLELTVRHIEAQGFTVLTQKRVPAGDGGLALGQAAIASAQILKQIRKNDDCTRFGGARPCVSGYPAEL